MAVGKTGQEMEQRVFMKASHKVSLCIILDIFFFSTCQVIFSFVCIFQEEYLNLVAKLILHVRQMSQFSSIFKISIADQRPRIVILSTFYLFFRTSRPGNEYAATRWTGSRTANYGLGY